MLSLEAFEQSIASKPMSKCDIGLVQRGSPLSPCFFFRLLSFVLQSSSLTALGRSGRSSFFGWVLADKKHLYETLPHILDIFFLIPVTLRLENNFTIPRDAVVVSINKSLFPPRW